MSMNLIFMIKGSTSSAYVDFPYQTKTNLTHAVLKETDKEKRIALIEDDISQELDESYKEYLMNRVKDMMNDETLELSLI